MKVREYKKRVKYTAFSCLSGGDKTLVGNAVNCDLSDGKIKAADGLSFYSIPGAPSLEETEYGVWRFARVNYGGETICLYVSGQGSLWVYEPSTRYYRLLESWIFPEAPTVFTIFQEDGTEMLAFVSPAGVYIFNPKDYTSRRVTENGSVAACVLHDRIFTAKGYTVYFCAPLEYENWAADADGGGFIELPTERGEIVGLISMDGKIVAFAERGIFVLKAGGAAREFEVEEIGYGGGELYQGSVTESGNYAVFLAKDGGYRFGGKKVKKLFDSTLYGEVDSCVCTSFEGKAFVTVKRGTGKKTVVVDAERESAYLLSAEFSEGLTGSKDKLCFASAERWCVAVETGELPAGAERSFKVRAVDFGVSGEKLLKCLRVYGRGCARVAVSGEREGHAYTVRDFEEGVTLYPLLKGRRFHLTLSPESGAEIVRLEVDIVKYG